MTSNRPGGLETACFDQGEGMRGGRENWPSEHGKDLPVISNCQRQENGVQTMRIILGLALVGITGYIGYLIGAHYFGDLYYSEGMYGYSGVVERTICTVMGIAFGVLLVALLSRKEV